MSKHEGEHRLQSFEADLTPTGAVRQLVGEINFPLGRVLDPCAGSGVFGMCVREAYSATHIVSIEPRPECRPVLARHYDAAHTMGFAEWSKASSLFGVPQFDAVISNPPFSRLREFLPLAHKHVRPGGAIVFLGLSTLGQADVWRDVFDDYPPVRQLRIGGRLSFRGDRVNPKTGGQYGADQRDYSWWEWSVGNGTRRQWVTRQLETLPAALRRYKDVEPGCEP